ncbi:hypothetical protein KEM56_006034 [Ascosphaera pollenicola]|nr:hypothetical protein KEM56_006034 [Ascosphaera pollenicola]
MRITIDNPTVTATTFKRHSPSPGAKQQDGQIGEFDHVQSCQPDAQSSRKHHDEAERKEDDDDLATELRKMSMKHGAEDMLPSVGTGVVFPTKFISEPKDALPSQLFPTLSEKDKRLPLFRYRHDDRMCLIYTHYACPSNGRSESRAGCSFAFGPERIGGVVSFPLEKKGPWGDPYDATNIRASLRAAIAALRYRPWHEHDIDIIVLATNLELLAKGATEWVVTWVKKNWKRTNNKKVENVNLWQAILGEIERWHRRGVEIQIWRLPDHLGGVHCRVAKHAAEAAANEDAPNQFQDV